MTKFKCFIFLSFKHIIVLSIQQKSITDKHRKNNNSDREGSLETVFLSSRHLFHLVVDLARRSTYE